MSHSELDCRGLGCPLPMVRLFKKNATLSIGDTVKVICDDPAFAPDVKAWCEHTGNMLVEIKTENKQTIAVIKKVK